MRKEYPNVPLQEQIFHPPKVWTAWPLPSDDVPREGETGWHEEGYTYKLKQKERPSRNLEDILVATTLKYAGERFASRESAEANVENSEEPLPSHNILQVDSDVEDQAGIVLVDGIRRSAKRSSVPQPQTQLRPVISADDERSRSILRPSVRHTLSMLDETLMALHHARTTCRRYSGSQPNTDDEGIAESVPDDSPWKRPKGRPRDFSDLTHRPLVPASIKEHLVEPSILLPKKKYPGRPKKVYPRLEGENEQEYLIRIARQQKKPMPSFASPAPNVPVTKSTSPKLKRNTPHKRATSEDLRNRHQRILGLRDWSEVVGTAALVGFSESVVARTTQRCANLFGQGMTMRVMLEVPFSERGVNTENIYQPEPIPELGEMEILRTSDDDGSNSGHDQTQMNTQQRFLNFRRQASCFCTHHDCSNSKLKKGYPSKLALRFHLQQGHDIPPDEIDDYILPSDEEMDGAIHIDKFLRPLKKIGRSKGRHNKRTAVKEVGNDTQSDDDVSNSDDGFSATSELDIGHQLDTNAKIDGDSE